jgi:hypothetical protein
MAHDQQLPKELQVELSGALRKPTSKQKESLALLADWWAVYGQIYRDDPTELLAVAFRETLEDLPSAVLHEACLRAQRESPQFRPTPGRVYELAETLLQKTQRGNRPKFLDEPKTSAEEREQALEETKQQREELRKKLGLRPSAGGQPSA